MLNNENEWTRIPVVEVEEVVTKLVKFSDEERRVLISSGAKLYLPRGETVKAQLAASRPFSDITHGYQENGRNRLSEFPARPIEVAIYPQPENFFVPDSLNKTTDEQIALIETDAQLLREELGLPNITEVLPEVSEATEVLFKHFISTGMRILGNEYTTDGKLSLIRTSTPINEDGSDVAYVGAWDRYRGLSVGGWYRNQSYNLISVARWVVPTGN